MLTVPTATRERIAEFYNLQFVTKEAVTSLGFSPIETVIANQLDFKLKLMMKDGVGSLCCVAYACWEDPDQQRDELEWRMLQIVLVKIADPTAS